MCGNAIYAGTDLGLGWENAFPTIWRLLMLHPAFWISQKLIFYLLLSYSPPSQQKKSLKANISTERPSSLCQSGLSFLQPPSVLPFGISWHRHHQVALQEQLMEPTTPRGLQKPTASQNILPHAKGTTIARYHSWVMFKVEKRGGDDKWALQ